MQVLYTAQHPLIVHMLKAGKFSITHFWTEWKTFILPRSELLHTCRITTNKCEDAHTLFTENIILLYLLFHVGSIQVTWDTFNLRPGFPVLWWVVGNTQVEKQKEQHFLYIKEQRTWTEPVSLKFKCIVDCFLSGCHWYPAIMVKASLTGGKSLRKMSFRQRSGRYSRKRNKL